MSAVDFETALQFVISLRPRMAVEDADAAARRLMGLVDSPIEAALAAKDFGKAALLSPKVMNQVRADKKIQAIKELRNLIWSHHGSSSPAGGSWLKEAKDAVEERRVAINYPENSPCHPDSRGWR